MEVPAKFRSVLTGFRYWLLVLIFMAASTSLVACSGGDTTVVTTNTTTTTTTTTLPPVVDDLDIIPDAPIDVSTKDTVTIYVLAKDGTDEVEGEMIYFDINPNPSGASLSAPSDETGPGGVASVIYTAGFFNIPATDTITARTLSGITETVDITVNPPDVGSIVIEDHPDELTADGTDQMKITVTVEDVNGDPAAGVDIDLTTTAGDLCAYPAPVTCNEAQPYTIATDEDGIVEITLQSSVNLGTATIEAETPEGLTDSTTVEFVVGAPANIALSAQPSTITANGIKTSTISATVTDANSHLVGSGETIYFAIINPLIDPGTLSASSAVSVNGIAQVTYSPGTSTGDVDIEASTSGGGIITQATPLITLTSEVVDTIDLVLGKTILVADGADNTLVTATVTNTDGFPVVDGTPVDFTTTGGDLGITTTITPPVPALTASTVGGVASVYLQSSTTLGAYTVSANSGGKFDFEQVEFVAGLANAGFSSLAANPTPIEADGEDTAVLVLVAKDAGDDPVVDGTVVEFTTSHGTICDYTDTLCTAPADPLIATTTGGVALAIIRSTTIPTDPVNLSADIDTSGLGTFSTYITVTNTMVFGDNDSINPNYITLTLTGGGGDEDGTYLPVESPSGNSAILVEATVLDGFGSPIPDNCTDNIEFEIISGPADAKLDGSTATVTKTTDSGGSASVSLTAGTTTGTVRIQVRAVKESDCSALLNVFTTTTPVVIGSGEAKFLYIYPNPDVIDNPDSTTSQVINAMVTDAYGNPVEDGTAVDFTLVDPELGEGVCLTGSTGASTDACGGSATPMQGVARTMLTWAPSFIWGSYILNASTSVDPPVNAVTDTYYGDYPAVAPLSIDVSFIPTSSVPSVSPGIELWVELRDGSNLPYNNPINGITMDFTSNNPGVLDIGAPASDVTGDPNTPGFATVDADVLNCSTSSVNVSVTATVSGSPYSDSATLAVSGNDQTAAFGTPVPGGSGTFLFTFNDTSVGQTSGGGITYSWDFGDSSCPGPADCSQQNPTHDYTAAGAGTYNVTLTTTMGTGCAVTSSPAIPVVVPIP